MVSVVKVCLPGPPGTFVICAKGAANCAFEVVPLAITGGRNTLSKFFLLYRTDAVALGQTRGAENRSEVTQVL